MLKKLILATVAVAALGSAATVSARPLFHRHHHHHHMMHHRHHMMHHRHHRHM